MTIYNWNEQWKPAEFPTILAIGDSWFWYPKENNLLEGIARLPALKDDYRSMVRLGQNGALLADYVDVPGRKGKFSEQLNAQLKPDTLKYYSIFMVSGGGNDAVDYHLALKEDCSNLTNAADCIDAIGLGQLVKILSQSMGLLLHEVYSAFQLNSRPAPLTFLHGYDYAIPDGRGFSLPALTLAGPWLKPAMDKSRVPADFQLRKDIVRLLIDQVCNAFKQFENPSAGVYFVDCRGTLNSGLNFKKDWDNELHPNNKGFTKILEKRWLPALREAGLAKIARS